MQSKVTEELKMDTWLRIIVLMAVLIALPAFSLAADADAGAAKAEPCLSCHYSDDFVGETEADILTLIEAARAPDSGHPADDNALSEADLADIAAFLARGE